MIMIEMKILVMIVLYQLQGQCDPEQGPPYKLGTHLIRSFHEGRLGQRVATVVGIMTMMLII